MVAKLTYLERYLAGEYEQVWAELQGLGEAVREEPLHGDALARHQHLEGGPAALLRSRALGDQRRST